MYFKVSPRTEKEKKSWVWCEIIEVKGGPPSLVRKRQIRPVYQTIIFFWNWEAAAGTILQMCLMSLGQKWATPLPLLFWRVPNRVCFSLHCLQDPPLLSLAVSWGPHPLISFVFLAFRHTGKALYETPIKTPVSQVPSRDTRPFSKEKQQGKYAEPIVSKLHYRRWKGLATLSAKTANHFHLLRSQYKKIDNI